MGWTWGVWDGGLLGSSSAAAAAAARRQRRHQRQPPVRGWGKVRWSVWELDVVDWGETGWSHRRMDARRGSHAGESGSWDWRGKPETQHNARPTTQKSQSRSFQRIGLVMKNNMADTWKGEYSIKNMEYLKKIHIKIYKIYVHNTSMLLKRKMSKYKLKVVWNPTPRTCVS